MLHVFRIPFTVHCPLFSAFLLSIYRFRCFACVAAFAVHPRCLNWKLKNCLLQFVATIGWPYTVAGDAPSLSVAVSHRTCHSPRTRLAPAHGSPPPCAVTRSLRFSNFRSAFGVARAAKSGPRERWRWGVLLFDAAPGPPAVAAAVEVVAVVVAAPSCAREFSNIVRYTCREWVYGHLSASVWQI